MEWEGFLQLVLVGWWVGSGPRLRAGYCLVPKSAFPGANQQMGQGKPLVPVG